VQRHASLNVGIRAQVQGASCRAVPASVFLELPGGHQFLMKELAMTTIQPEGEDLRNAVKWISEERKYGSSKKLSKLIEEACLKFDLSPVDAEYLSKFIGNQGT
jgi:hypothetical protein